MASVIVVGAKGRMGRLICDAVEDFSGKRKEIQESVDDLCSRFPIYESKFKS